LAMASVVAESRPPLSRTTAAGDELFIATIMMSR
jgi:hypothetical protein